jgi:hypothetical protein
VPTEAIRRHITAHYENAIDRELAASGRGATHLRLVVSGDGEEDEEEVG